MFRRIFALLLLLTLPLMALADETAPYEVCTFAGYLPDRLVDPFAALIPDDSCVVSGAAIQHRGDHYGDSPSSLDAYTALVLADTAEGLRLYAAAWVENLPWQVTDRTGFLRQAENASISIYMPGSYRIPVLSVDYAADDGLISDLLCFWNNEFWCVSGHIDQTSGVTVVNGMNALVITDREGEAEFISQNPYCLDYMTGIADFPVTRAQAQAAAAEPADFPEAGSIVYAGGANLRKEPTGSSESLGVYAHNTPMVFTGEQKKGTAWPWYQVRIGDTVGWMSSNYIKHEPDYGHNAIPLGRTPEGCLMYAAPGDERACAQLTDGVTFHILAEYEGMYHICIPGEVSWAAATDGAYGYVAKEGILTGASPSALDALENAQ